LFKKCEVIVNLVEEAQFGDDDDDPDGDEVRVSP